jgi:hypothetical protein
VCQLYCLGIKPKTSQRERKEEAALGGIANERQPQRERRPKNRQGPLLGRYLQHKGDSARILRTNVNRQDSLQPWPKSRHKSLPNPTGDPGVERTENDHFCPRSYLF